MQLQKGNSQQLKKAIYRSFIQRIHPMCPYHFTYVIFRYKEFLGFKPQTAFLCQGATLSKEVLEYLAGFDILVHETYGQSETSGLLCANIPKRYCKLGTTGKVGIHQNHSWPNSVL